MKAFVPIVAAILMVSHLAGTALAVSYNVTDLGTLSGDNASTACAINNSGQVVGDSYSSNGATHAFRTAPNQPINPATDFLGTLGGTKSWAFGINDSGQVAGYAYTSNGATHAFRTAANSAISLLTDDLGTLGGLNSWAYGISASGQVAGIAALSGGATHAFRTAADQPINPATDNLGGYLGTPGSDGSGAYGINDSGQVVGNASTSSGAVHAFRTAANQPINPATDDLGTLGGSTSQAKGINNSGQVVGDSSTGRYRVIGGGFTQVITHAFRTQANSAINPLTDDLGTLGLDSFAKSINDSGQVVGYFETLSGSYDAFLVSGDGPMQDLNTLIPPGSGWSLWQALDINDLGQIVGYGTNPSGQLDAFRLDPIIGPEPSTFALLAVGALIFSLAYAWRRWGQAGSFGNSRAGA
jgi:probable HAF family extracellular repeat protein